MYRLDDNLNRLIETGKQQGFLTFTQVNDYLPDEAVNPEKLDNLLMSLDELGLDTPGERFFWFDVDELQRGIACACGPEPLLGRELDAQRALAAVEMDLRAGSNRPQMDFPPP